MWRDMTQCSFHFDLHLQNNNNNIHHNLKVKLDDTNNVSYSIKKTRTYIKEILMLKGRRRAEVAGPQNKGLTKKWTAKCKDRKEDFSSQTSLTSFPCRSARYHSLLLIILFFSLHRITSSYAKFPKEGSSGKRFIPTPHNDHIKFITDYHHWDCFLSPLLFSQFIINVLQSCKFARNESLDKTERTKSSVKLSAERTCSEETQLQFLAKFHTAPSLKICDVLSLAGLIWRISGLFNFIFANQISTCAHKLKFIMQVGRRTGQEPLIAWTEKGEQGRGWREAGPSASTLQNCLAHYSQEIPLGMRASSPSRGGGWGGGVGGGEQR